MNAQRLHTSILSTTLALAAAPAIGAEELRLPHQAIMNEPTVFAAAGHGTYVAAVGDWDGDGYQDYAVAAQNYVVGALGAVGRVYVYSGRSTALIQSFDGDQVATDFGTRMVDVGDATGDGVADLAISAHKYDAGFGKSGAVFLYDGATGARVWTFGGDADSGQVGIDIGVTADRTGDGVLDLVVGDPAWGPGTGQGRVYFVDGATGQQLGEATGDLFFSSFGKRVATRRETTTVIATNAKGAVFDVPPPLSGVSFESLLYPAPAGATVDTADLDLVLGPGGVLRLLVGWRYADIGGMGNAGTVRLYDIGAALPFLQFDGTAALDFYGLDVTRVPDTDGDGVEDIAFLSSSNLTVGDRTRVVSQVTGAVLDDFVYGGFGINPPLGAIADVTGDGRSEILYGDGNSGQSWMYARGLSVTSTDTTGGDLKAVFEVDLAAPNAGALYLQLYGVSGFEQGTMGGPGWAFLPLNIDAVTLAVLNLTGTPAFPDAFGVLDAAGMATTSMSLPAGAIGTLTGLKITSAATALVGGVGVATTNPVELVVP